MNLFSPKSAIDTDFVRMPKTLEQTSSSVYKRYYALAQEFNAIQHLGLSAKLRTPHQKVMEAILYKYLPMFRKLVNSSTWVDSQSIPSINITRRELARLISCETRNIYNILARLSNARFIDIVDNNSTGGYTIIPNLYIAFGDVNLKPQLKALTALPKDILITQTWQTFPILKDRINLNNTYIAVDVESTHENYGERHREIDREKKQIEPFELSFPKNTLESSTNDKENETSCAADTDDVDNYASGRAEYFRNRHLGGFNSPLPHRTTKPVQEKPIQPHEKAQLITEFWNYAKKNLYPKQKFNGETEVKIKRLIGSDVFGHFNGTESYIHWKTFCMTKIAEVDLVKKHNEKYDREAYWPLNYFSKKYRDRGGFLIAHVWLKREQKKFLEVRFEDELEKAKNSLAFGIIPRGQKGKILSISELSLYWAKRISKRTSPETLEKYYSFISNTNLSSQWTN